MAKQKPKNPVNDFLKEVKQNSKAIVKLLKGLKKTGRTSPQYEAILNKAVGLFEEGLTAVTNHRDAPKKAAVEVPAKAAAVSAKKAKKKAAAPKKKKK